MLAHSTLHSVYPYPSRSTVRVPTADLSFCGMQSESRNASASQSSTPSIIPHPYRFEIPTASEGEHSQVGRREDTDISGSEIYVSFSKSRRNPMESLEPLAQPSWSLNRLSPPVTRPASLALSLITGHMPCRAAGGETTRKIESLTTLRVRSITNSHTHR